MSDGNRTLLVDASVFITLAEVDSIELLQGMRGRVSMPESVIDEITSDPATAEVNRVVGNWVESSALVNCRNLVGEWEERLEKASEQLGRPTDSDKWGGDVPLLAAALYHQNPVVITDDKPLRQTCKTLSIPVSGSIGVLVRAVERGDIEAGEAKDKLHAMDEVGARLSASLVRRAKRLIDDAASEE